MLDDQKRNAADDEQSGNEVADCGYTCGELRAENLVWSRFSGLVHLPLGGGLDVVLGEY